MFLHIHSCSTQLLLCLFCQISILQYYWHNTNTYIYKRNAYRGEKKTCIVTKQCRYVECLRIGRAIVMWTIIAMRLCTKACSHQRSNNGLPSDPASYLPTVLRLERLSLSWNHNPLSVSSSVFRGSISPNWPSLQTISLHLSFLLSP